MNRIELNYAKQIPYTDKHGNPAASPLGYRYKHDRTTADACVEIYDAFLQGETIFIQVDEKANKHPNAIARVLKFDEDFIRDVEEYKNSERQDYVCNRVLPSFHVGWDDRKNKAKLSTRGGYRPLIWLKGYEGPTVWTQKDKKDTLAEMTKDQVIEDRFGEVIEVGVKVLYLNARYGGGVVISQGIVKEINNKLKQYGDDYWVEPTVVVTNSERNVEESKINCITDNIIVIRDDNPLYNKF